MVLPGDVTTDVDAIFDRVEQEWGTVDVLVANAGAAASAPLARTTDEIWQRQLDVNLTAPFRCTRRAVPAMVSQRWGRVVVVASMAAKHGEPYLTAYCAAKHGVLGMVRAVATEVVRSGVTVNAVCPAYVDTPMTDESVRMIAEKTGRSLDEARAVLAGRQPVGRLITVDEVTDAVMLCVGNGAITGQGINVDGGAVQS
jgi:NAD(P)-dependent dehydrogenase (short-subunit alcohol dehydrogenase family)